MVVSHSLVVDNIARLITNDPRHEAGLLGELRNAWLIAVDGLIDSVGIGPVPAADERIDADERCVLPGFVDSHSHLVFGGDRADEFAARMAGRPYEAGGIRTTVAATRRPMTTRSSRGPPRCWPRHTDRVRRRWRSSPATA